MAPAAPWFPPVPATSTRTVARKGFYRVQCPLPVGHACAAIKSCLAPDATPATLQPSPGLPRSRCLSPRPLPAIYCRLAHGTRLRSHPLISASLAALLLLGTSVVGEQRRGGSGTKRSRAGEVLNPSTAGCVEHRRLADARARSSGPSRPGEFVRPFARAAPPPPRRASVPPPPPCPFVSSSSSARVPAPTAFVGGGSSVRAPPPPLQVASPPSPYVRAALVSCRGPAPVASRASLWIWRSTGVPVQQCGGEIDVGACRIAAATRDGWDGRRLE